MTDTWDGGPRRPSHAVPARDGRTPTAALVPLPALRHTQLGLLDHLGTLVAVDHPWPTEAGPPPPLGLRGPAGVNYLHTCTAVAAQRPDDGPAWLAGVRAVLAGTQRTFALDYADQPTAAQRWYRGWVTALPGPPPVCAAVGHEEITAQIQSEQALRHQTLHDALTGLPNRLLLHDRLAQAIHLAQRDGRPLALLLLDLDRFKEVNDTLGHHAGDLLLQQVAARLHHVLRAVDTVARLGGDEFAVLLPQDDQHGALQVVDRLQAEVARPLKLAGHAAPLHVGASVGLALYPDHGHDGPTLLRHADVAMYTAKRTHAACAIYNPTQDPHSPDRLLLAGALQQAIARGQLLLEYQPKVALATGCIYGLEALVRWRHPQHGLLPPGAFIPLAEQTGLIGPLTVWVLEAALQACRAWRQAHHALDVAVNLSMLTLHDPRLPTMIRDLLRRYALPAEVLWLEVTETAAMTDAARAVETLGHLAALGVRLSIDDFGTGYSSLAYLKRLPVHELKLDQSFVRGVVADAADTAIVAATVTLSHTLGRTVMAEGVETAEVWARLQRLGCDAVQGYHVTRPLPPEAVMPWLQQAGWAVGTLSARTPYGHRRGAATYE